MFGLHLSTHHTLRRLALALALIGWMSGIAPPVYSRTGPQSSSPAQSGLTLEDRINYQRAIEEVYWRHRIWPTENRQAKPALDEVMPLSAIQAKVEDYLRKSQALGAYWQRPIAGEQLQAEMERMARQTKQPAILKELWAALGNDPYVIAECLARPSLANRLISNWYAHDERYHGALKAQAEAELRAYGNASQMRQMSGEYREVEWVSSPHPRVAGPGEGADTMALNSDEWADKVRELAQVFGGGAIHDSLRSAPTVTAVADRRYSTAELDLLPIGELSRLQEDDERFYVTAVMDKGKEHVKLATVEWKKQPFDAWWEGGEPLTLSRLAGPPSPSGRGAEGEGTVSQSKIEEPSYHYRLVLIGSAPGECADDTWQPTLTPFPGARAGHTAVWTGSEMIVWGGYNSGSVFKTGGRYDPATDTWTATATNNAPSPRAGHTAVWTGSEMIVWGGYADTYVNTGGRYDPASDTWMATATTNAPSARDLHTAVWTGTRMIVWGGYADTYVNTGGRYDPATDSWMETATTNAPSARYEHTAVWTGTEMIVWGGFYIFNGVSHFLNTGGRYDPTTDSWTATTTNNAPSERSNHTAVWTGTEMIVWGGIGPGSLFNAGGRYDPAADSWTATATTNAPSATQLHTAVWTGAQMIVWGGDADTYVNTGGRYDPASDSWTATATTNAPSARSGHTAVWTGTEMIVWGGLAGPPPYFNTGGRYDPASDSWTATATNNAPSARELHTAVWTGTEMIVWGGWRGVGAYSPSNTGGRYDPATDSWTTTATSNAPSARAYHTAVWTGSEMIVWGGLGRDSLFNTGGRYDPASDTWMATTTTNAPSARFVHTAVWTGSEMIVWGGGALVAYFNTGGRYDPASDSWTATATTNAPSARYYHTAVWTGAEMIVWGGGSNGLYLDTGGRYDPASDSWTATATTNGPSPRGYHTAVWTGTEMIVWGGYNGLGLDTGGRYDPTTDSWMETATTNAPSARYYHTAVWTGAEMMVWGGVGPGGPSNTGGRYDPATDTWTATATTNAPSARYNHTAVWTGTEMIVWGGYNGWGLDTGGRYCASAGCSPQKYHPTSRSNFFEPVFVVQPVIQPWPPDDGVPDTTTQSRPGAVLLRCAECA